MAENTVMERKRPEKVTRKDLWIGWFLWWFGNQSMSGNIRKGGSGMALFMGWICRRFYNQEDLADCMTRHTEFYMSDYVFGNCISGIMVAMEEQRANELYETGESAISTDMISAVKTGLMGPFAGFGDTVTQTILFVICLAIGQQLAIQGNILGAVICLLSHACWRPCVSFIMQWPGYSQGKAFAMKLTSSEFARKLMVVAGIVSMMMMGALTASTVKFNPSVAFANTDLISVLDRVAPGLRQAGPVFLMYFALRKNVKVIWIVFGIIIACLLLALVGFFG